MAKLLSIKRRSDLLVTSSIISPSREGISQIIPDIKYEILYNHGHLYDIAYVGHEGDVQFYSDQAKSGRVLYLGVGTGRIFAAAVKMNLHVIGIDNSQSMVNVMLSRFPHVRSNQVIMDDVFSVELPPNSFDKIIAPFSFFTQFEKEKSIFLMQKLKDWLVPGGVLVTDFFSPFQNPISKNVETKLRKLPKGVSVRTYYVYNHVEQKLFEYTLVKQKKEVVLLELKLNYFYPKEIREMAKDAGYIVDSLYGGFNKENLTTVSQLIVASFRKE